MSFICFAKFEIDKFLSISMLNPFSFNKVANLIKEGTSKEYSLKSFLLNNSNGVVYSTSKELEKTITFEA